MTQQPQHENGCIHSRVCRFRFVSDPDCDGRSSPNSAVCKSYESRPATSPGASIPELVSNTYRCCEKCPNVLSKPVFKCNCSQPQHDAAIRNEERNATLDEFAKEIQQRYIGKYDNEAGDIPEVPVDEIAEIIQSLRSTKERDPK